MKIVLTLFSLIDYPAAMEPLKASYQLRALAMVMDGESAPLAPDKSGVLRGAAAVIEELTRQVSELKRTSSELEMTAYTNGWREGAKDVIRQLRAFEIHVVVTDPRDAKDEAGRSGEGV